MYHLYTTEAFVLRVSPVGEANNQYTLFTRELGLVRAVAQGVRFEKSKLRHALLEYSYSTVVLVRGKNSWRLTSAAPLGVTYRDLRCSSVTGTAVFVRACSLLRRLLHGEEKNGELFDTISSAYRFVRAGELSEDLVVSFEYLFALRVLYHLGYVGDIPAIHRLIASPYWDNEILKDMGKFHTEALSEINRSLGASQL